jgi:predicted site-specific integrase-resolvase
MRTLLVRRGEAREMLGVSVRAFRRLVATGAIRPRLLGPGQQAVFVRSEVEEVRESTEGGKFALARRGDTL